MSKYTLEDWEWVGRNILLNTEAYETFNPLQLQHVIKMIRHFVSSDEEIHESGYRITARKNEPKKRSIPKGCSFEG